MSDLDNLLHDEVYSKDNRRAERMKRSKKARDHRHMIQDKLDREHERGYKGKR